jgi:hypothetical protein
MPKVLSRLRVDEVSCVTKGAGEGTRVVLMKRDDSSDRAGFYHRLFAKGGSGRVVRPPRRLRGSEPLSDLADAKHALLHSPDGRSLMRDAPSASIDELSAHLLEASGSVTNKKDTNMNKMELIVKSETGMHAFCKGLVDRGIPYPHPEFDSKVLEPYAKNKFPALHVGNAIAKVLAEEPPVAAAYSAVHSAYHPAYAVAKAAVTMTTTAMPMRWPS